MSVSIRMRYNLLSRKAERRLTMFESFEKVSYGKGTVEEMQLRYVFAAIRKAADDCKKYVKIPKYDINHLHIPTLEFEILRPAGFEFKLLTPENDQQVAVDTILVCW